MYRPIHYKSPFLSDFHQLVVTSLKFSFKKPSAKEICYRDYKSFDVISFKEELSIKLRHSINDYKSFETVFLSILEKHAPMKKKVIRANHVPYMTKNLRKAIMKRSQLASKYRKNPTEINNIIYKNFVVGYIRKKERNITTI